MSTQPKILCIEDDVDTSKLIAFILERHGYQVIPVIGGQQGLDAVKSHKPDLVLLDLMMPDVDGWEVFRQMKADSALKDIPVIAVTAKSEKIDKVLGLRIAKVDDYVTKPFTPQDLLQSVQKILPAGKPTAS